MLDDKYCFVWETRSWKGYSSSFLKSQYDLVHISTGDLFRFNIKNKTELGILAKSYLDKGDLVPDRVTIIC